MVFSDDILMRVLTFAFALFGFWIAKHIHKHKKVDEAPLVCPVGFDCNAVVHSDYSKFLGINLEILGMVYYGLMSLSYLFLIFMPDSLPSVVVYFVITGAFVAFLFSLYLIFIQIFVLKKGCSWCFVSAGVSISIFILTLLAYDFDKIFRSLS